MSRHACVSLLFGAAVVALAGCRMGVPIHVWQPPLLESTVGKQVVLSTVAGPEPIADPIKQDLIAMAPHDQGRSTQIVDAASLQNRTEIQLVSASDQEVNDLAVAAVARRQGGDFLLRGEVIEDRHPAASKSDEDPVLKISWRLNSLDGARPVRGRPVIVDLESAVQRHPDLALLSDPQRVLRIAAVRETYCLMTPFVDRQYVELAIPYGLPGSREVRVGNAAALAGRWGQAAVIWEQVLEQHPAQVAALHNLALAAVAGQDFSRGKALARKAIRLQPTPLHQQTLVWIELRQRDYHEAFSLPEPPEGWFVTN
jgi:hypothetical protein